VLTGRPRAGSRPASFASASVRALLFLAFSRPYRTSLSIENRTLFDHGATTAD
jgi:hypothetical protein